MKKIIFSILMSVFATNIQAETSFKVVHDKYQLRYSISSDGIAGDGHSAMMYVTLKTLHPDAEVAAFTLSLGNQRIQCDALITCDGWNVNNKTYTAYLEDVQYNGGQIPWGISIDIFDPSASDSSNQNGTIAFGNEIK